MYHAERTNWTTRCILDYTVHRSILKEISPLGNKTGPPTFNHMCRAWIWFGRLVFEKISKREVGYKERLKTRRGKTKKRTWVKYAEINERVPNSINRKSLTFQKNTKRHAWRLADSWVHFHVLEIGINREIFALMRASLHVSCHAAKELEGRIEENREKLSKFPYAINTNA